MFRIFTNLIAGMAAEIGMWIEGDRAATLKVGLPLMIGSEYFSHLKKVEVRAARYLPKERGRKLSTFRRRKRNQRLEKGLLMDKNTIWLRHQSHKTFLVCRFSGRRVGLRPIRWPAVKVGDHSGPHR
ncbi:hypothetical protein [Bradyrhizobium sp. Gha]|uniref:hypothetical protein n=1 Tax=Bradyrhizobium sp. Gha TaxID=1855318 RepID=UPI001160774A|nr:hypothetical protein [Bradyrhizobium sp. Gha]